MCQLWVHSYSTTDEEEISEIRFSHIWDFCTMWNCGSSLKNMVHYIIDMVVTGDQVTLHTFHLHYTAHLVLFLVVLLVLPICCLLSLILWTGSIGRYISCFICSALSVTPKITLFHQKLPDRVQRSGFCKQANKLRLNHQYLKTKFNKSFSDLPHSFVSLVLNIRFD